MSRQEECVKITKAALLCKRAAKDSLRGVAAAVGCAVGRGARGWPRGSRPFSLPCQREVARPQAVTEGLPCGGLPLEKAEVCGEAIPSIFVLAPFDKGACWGARRRRAQRDEGIPPYVCPGSRGYSGWPGIGRGPQGRDSSRPRVFAPPQTGPIWNRPLQRFAAAVGHAVGRGLRASRPYGCPAGTPSAQGSLARRAASLGASSIPLSARAASSARSPRI